MGNGQPEPDRLENRSTHELLVIMRESVDRDAETFEQAFTVIYARYRDMFFHIAYRILRDQQLAENAYQEAFLKLIPEEDRQGIRGYDPVRGAADAWLGRIARHAAVDYYRRIHPEALLPEEYGDETSGDPSEASQEWEDEALRAVWDSLTSGQKEAIEGGDKRKNEHWDALILIWVKYQALCPGAKEDTPPGRVWVELTPAERDILQEGRTATAAYRKARRRFKDLYTAHTA